MSTRIFRRCCDVCSRTVDWREDGTEDGEFFHKDDKTPLCEGGIVALEVKEIG